MSRGITVPITSEVLKWAINNSGFSINEIVDKLKEPESVILSWIKGESEPSLTKFKRLSEILNRPTAFFLLPEPPTNNIPETKFRHPIDGSRTHANPKELRYLRESVRLQSTLSWIRKELNIDKVDLHETTINQNVDDISTEIRNTIGVTSEAQMNWNGSTGALKAWRDLLEQQGIYIFFYPMGGMSCRGFSLWDSHAPCIAVNTHWNNEARIFTIFHELGHLLTRSNSICLTPASHLKVKGGDALERWCERFAAAILLPWEPVTKLMRDWLDWREGSVISDLDDLRLISRTFKVSLRATALRLIEKGAAEWTLYDEIPQWSDDKKGGGGGKGRKRKKMREDSYGKAATNTFVAALNDDLISRTDVLSYLNVSDNDLYSIQEETR